MGGFLEKPNRRVLYDYYVKLLESENKKIFMICDDNIHVGYLQIDKESIYEYGMNYGILVNFRGKDYGMFAISEGQKYIKKINNNSIIANFVLCDNIASQKVLLKNGLVRLNAYKKIIFHNKIVPMLLFIDSESYKKYKNSRLLKLVEVLYKIDDIFYTETKWDYIIK